MSGTRDVVVIGGGIIGLTSAYALATDGRSVEVVERGEFGREASWAGAGIVPPGNFAAAATPIDRLRAYGSEHYPGFSATLRGETGIDNEFTVTGGVELLTETESTDYIPRWRAERITVEAVDAPLGIAVPAGLAAWHLPGFANVRNPRHLKALVAACQRIGVTLTANVAVEGWSLGSGRVTGVKLRDGRTLRAENFVLAAGAWAGNLLTELGLDVGIHPVRGQVVAFRTRPGTLPALVLCGKRYAVPRRDGLVLVGATEEPEAGFNKGTTPDAIAVLTAFARNLIPALRDAEVESCWSGLRPGSADGLPTIDRVPGRENVVAAVGHFRAGIQLSIGTAEIVRSLITGRPSPIDPTGFAFGRKPDLTARPAFRS
jgi:glycine oxidase